MFTATIRLKRGGKLVLSESRTFDNERSAERWMKRRETELAKPGALATATAPKDGSTLADAINKYVEESRKAIGKTKAQVLEAIKAYDIADKRAEEITSDDIVTFARQLGAGGRQPQTVLNYLSHLSAVFTIARPAWRMPLDPVAMRDALAVTKRLGLTGKSRQRTRRPTLDEITALLAHYAEREHKNPHMVPMRRLIAFAVLSTRRLGEITRILWVDVEPGRVLVRDMKHPGEKIGNDVWCELPPEAEAVMPARHGERVFPYDADTISTNFTRACKLLGIEDLHFHDLRHDGVSRLFEMGRTVPLAASVSGHRSWQSLQRYTHVRQTGDKYDGFDWHN